MIFIRDAESKTRSKRAFYKCEKCNKEIERSKQKDIHISEFCKSCTRLKNNANSNDSGTRLHNIYKGMLSRTSAPITRTSNYRNYVLRGITVSDEWMDFQVFKKWSLKNGYKSNLTIDRKNNDGNYCESNCRWITITKQQENKQHLTIRNKTGKRGVSYDKSRDNYKSEIMIKRKKILIGRFKTIDEASSAYDNFIIKNKIKRKTNEEAAMEVAGK